MKKKSFFRSYSAKLALAVLAISGALLTGCSKDDGIEIKGPNVTVPPVVIPPSETTYSVVVSVLDATTLQPVAAEVSDGATKKSTAANNAVVTFTYADAPDKTYTVTPADGDAYKSGSAALKADAIKEGAAVYPITVYLQRKGGEEPDPEKTEYKYDLTLKAFDYTSGEEVADAEIKIFKVIDGGREELTSLTNVEAGTYVIEASAPKYVKTTVYKVLNSVLGVDPENIQLTIGVTLYKEGEKDGYTVKGNVLFNGEPLNYNSLVIYNQDKSKVYENKGTAPGFSVEIPEEDYTPVTRALAAGEYYINLLFVITVESRSFEVTKRFTLIVTAEGVSISEEDVPVSAVVKLVEGTPSSWTNKKDIASSNFPIYNTKAEKEYTFIKFALTSGKQVTITTTPSSGPIGKLITEALEAYPSVGYTTSISTFNNIEVGPYTEILSAYYNQVFTKTVIDLVLETTVNGKTENEPLADKVIVEEAGVVTISSFNFTTKDLSHDHGHGHGHGGTNAGGGIIEGE